MSDEMRPVAFMFKVKRQGLISEFAAIDYNEQLVHGQWETIISKEPLYGQPEIDALKEQLSKFQMSEFHPDWSLLEASQGAIREHLAEIKRLHEMNLLLSSALETAKTGLLWYQDMFPDVVDASDHDAMRQINEALAQGGE